MARVDDPERHFEHDQDDESDGDVRRDESTLHALLPNRSGLVRSDGAAISPAWRAATDGNGLERRMTSG